MKRAIIGLIFLAFACSKGGFTPPSIIPTPIPTPIPVPTPTPAPLWPWGAIICCDDPLTPGVDEGLRDGWSLATEAALKKMAEAGASFTHFRTGPFSDGSETIPELITAVQIANSLGIRPEIDLIDNWALATGNNAWGDNCGITHAAPRPRHLQHVRTVVEATNTFNVTYNLGNEGFRCNPVSEWDRGLYNEAKAAGAGSVGTNSGLGIGDYVTTHGFEPTSSGQYLTESDNDPHTPEEWVELYKVSRSRGGYVMFWRSEMSDSEWQRLLNLMKERP